MFAFFCAAVFFSFCFFSCAFPKALCFSCGLVPHVFSLLFLPRLKLSPQRYRIPESFPHAVPAELAVLQRSLPGVGLYRGCGPDYLFHPKTLPRGREGIGLRLSKYSIFSCKIICIIWEIFERFGWIPRFYSSPKNTLSKLSCEFIFDLVSSSPHATPLAPCTARAPDQTVFILSHVTALFWSSNLASHFTKALAGSKWLFCFDSENPIFLYFPQRKKQWGSWPQGGLISKENTPLLLCGGCILFQFVCNYKCYG